jgi:hypothetical protein
VIRVPSEVRSRPGQSRCFQFGKKRLDAQGRVFQALPLQPDGRAKSLRIDVQEFGEQVIGVASLDAVGGQRIRREIRHVRARDE